MRLASCVPLGLFVVSKLSQNLLAQNIFTWQEIRYKFEAANLPLKGTQLNIDGSRAAELTSLRPNPDLSTGAMQPSRQQGVWRPFADTQVSPAIRHLHERANKHELRRDSAKEPTAISKSIQLDQERGVMFNLRNAFVQVLPAKAVLQSARGNLDCWGRELAISCERRRTEEWK